MIMNEVNMAAAFSKANLADMKRQLEGLGKVVHNKYGHPFNGFIDAFSLITC